MSDAGCSKPADILHPSSCILHAGCLCHHPASLSSFAVLALSAVAAATLVTGQLQARAQTARGLQVSRLEIDAASEPLGIDDRAPRLSWALASDRRGVMQTGYRVLVASRPELAREGKADVWDSGSVAPRIRGRLRGPAPCVPRRATSGQRAGALDSDLRSGVVAAGLVRDRHARRADWHGQWIAGPDAAGPLTDRRGRGRRCSDSRGAASSAVPCGWLTSGWSLPAKKNNQGECRELRPAPMLRKSFTVDEAGRAARGSTRPASRTTTSASTARATSDRVLEPGIHQLREDGALHDGRRHRAAATGRERDRGRARVRASSTTPARTWDWGWEEARVARDAAAAARSPRHVRRRHARTSSRPMRSGRSAPTGRRATTTTTSARPTTRGARCRDGIEPGFDDARLAVARASSTAPAGAVRAETHEPIRVVGARGAGHAHEPAPGIVVYDVGQNLTGWVELRGRGAGRHANRDLLLARSWPSDGHARARRQRLWCTGSCRPTTTSRAAAAARRGRRASATRAFSTCSSAARATQPLPEGVKASVTACGRCGRASPSTSTLRRRAADADAHPPQHVVGDPEQPARASSPTRRSTRRTAGPATRS